ncbi:16S rRNA (uracil(1498)-N(3))-methyltransferase [Candidatus Synechococcus calcipolaris G9]|uniref:Ribosomal RNA small subunit methyltransferase E n=1 Tax=Candidatus Synechococcus calcipolaris G9 TaxID=1497997 RepID=A0ABT6EX04_9SYNE|nr:16S rRNA (uracil(1498)-N(3))-methyltransferase [Candidatus Synechococcus calcipolaris]MDG2989435.1 16S rRNA (uracil(1498)-N(3))-methyltransferase [Candidatus Synechococcus calcipolaris G9]
MSNQPQEKKIGANLQRLVIAPDQVRDDNLSLTSAQCHYLYRVLRLNPGDRFLAMDGQGQRWLSQLGGVGEPSRLLEAAPISTELGVSIVLCMALVKGNSLDLVIQEATELGVREIIPIRSDRSLLQPSASKYQRWQRIAQEAAEQSQRLWVPKISTAIALDEMLTFEGARYMAGLATDAIPLNRALDQGNTHAKNIKKIYIAIGPEGGWTSQEVEQAQRAGWQTVSLGRRTLRAVTAAIAALALISIHYDGEDFIE